MELVSPAFRIDFREFCVGLYLRQIDDIFQMAGIQPGKAAREHSSARRTRVEEYYASIDWTDMRDVQKFLKAVELVLAQSYIGEEQKAFLRSLCAEGELVVDGLSIRLGGGEIATRIKNLIFAADGPKPEIVMVDATTNEIRIVKNEQYCLVYDRAILGHGLLWRELVEWWGERNQMTGLERAEIDLHARLIRSLTSEPEKVVFSAYFVHFRHILGDELPALLPQVYLHYDPYTIRQLQGKKRLPRQRMDFLLLLPHDRRIVIEIDGKHHYAEESGQASPRLYAEMVAEDRRLKLAGYEVYRFGGYEFIRPDKAAETVRAFFGALFERCSVTV